MEPTSTFGAILTTLQTGLPVLLLQFLITLVLLGVGVVAYFAI